MNIKFYANNKAQRVIELLTALCIFPFACWVEQDYISFVQAINLMIFPVGLSALNSIITNMLFRSKISQ